MVVAHMRQRFHQGWAVQAAAAAAALTACLCLAHTLAPAVHGVPPTSSCELVLVVVVVVVVFTVLHLPVACTVFIVVVCVYCASACASPNLTHAHWSRFVAALTARHGLTWTTQPLACVTPSPARPASIVTSAHPHDPTLTLAFLAQPHSGRLASPFHHALQPAIASIINITTSAATQPACRWHLSTRSLRTVQVNGLVADDKRCVFAKYHTSHMRVLRVRS